MGLIKKISKIALIYSITYFGLKSCSGVLYSQPISDLENKIQTEERIEYQNKNEYNTERY
jgi:hypothetical protein